MLSLLTNLIVLYWRYSIYRPHTRIMCCRARSIIIMSGWILWLLLFRSLLSLLGIRSVVWKISLRLRLCGMMGGWKCCLRSVGRMNIFSGCKPMRLLTHPLPSSIKGFCKYSRWLAHRDPTAAMPASVLAKSSRSPPQWTTLYSWATQSRTTMAAASSTNSCIPKSRVSWSTT